MKSLFNTGSAYGPISKFFHWIVAILVILMLSVSYFLDDIPNKNLVGVAFNAHKLAGLTILTLMVLRILWALRNPKPSLPGVKLWEKWAEHLVHWGLYIAVLLMPIAGWIGASAGGHPPRLGKMKLGLPLAKNENLADFAFSIHNSLAIIIIVLVSIHVLAALYHHFIRKDNVLRRMWP